MEHALEERAVARSRLRLLDLVDAQGRPGVDGRVHVAEVPLVRRDLAVGVHVPLAQHQHELVLGESGVDEGQDHAVKRQIPGGEPRELPGVRHREDVGVVEVPPVAVAALEALRRRGRLTGVAIEPAAHVVLVELLGPEHSGEGLPHHVLLFGREAVRDHGGVELVRFGLALAEDPVEVLAQRIAGRSRRRRSGAGARGRSRPRGSSRR